jgi:riboflavin biosynthesis pyrimidine reductase
MKPRIICHMRSTVDGKIDGDALRAVSGTGDYETTGAALGGDAWICGRTTMAQHFADGTFAPKSNAPAGPQPPHVARPADSYAISVDSRGQLLWSGGDLDGDHLVCVVSQQAPAEYLAMLRERQISYVVAGAQSVDLAQAVDQLARHFGIRTLLLEGGGHINGAFLEAGLVDEVSLLIAPGVDGRRDVPAVFDGITAAAWAATRLKLRSVDRRDNDILWLRYDVVRP